MHITVIRKPGKGCTLSTWYIDGKVFCYGCEDVLRVGYVKSETAIPAGTYRLVYTKSPRLGKYTLRLLDLSGKRTMFGKHPIDECGILIHVGNWARDSDGCLLPGMSILADQTGVQYSAKAVEKLEDLVVPLLQAKEQVTITIS